MSHPISLYVSHVIRDAKFLALSLVSLVGVTLVSFAQAETTQPMGEATLKPSTQQQRTMVTLPTETEDQALVFVEHPTQSKTSKESKSPAYRSVKCNVSSRFRSCY
ncbi:MAG: hypothetical protein ACKO37_04255 [Vampirovibrionales bacterium]